AGTSVRQIGVARLYLGEFAAAIDLLMRATAAVPGRPGSDRYDLALALLGGGRTDFAISEYQRAIVETLKSWQPWAACGFVTVAKIEIMLMAARFPMIATVRAPALEMLDAALASEPMAGEVEKPRELLKLVGDASVCRVALHQPEVEGRPTASTGSSDVSGV